MNTASLLAIATTTIVLAACATVPKPAAATSKGELAFQSTVKPLFEKRCVWCHGNRKALGTLNLQDRAATLDPAKRFVVPGRPAESRIYQAITKASTHPRVMPADGWGITKDQETAIGDWIQNGAPWPEGSAGRIHRKSYQVDHDDYR